ncbi:MAG: alpha-amylase family glycosyl hydrolase [Verrucomicrobiota bacterium]|nr:alpha-amylase family glycosyl hydrolase [Verrucomicrobiota bacterium]
MLHFGALKNERVRIYQLFVRLFGNLNGTQKTNGTLEENGVGKFSDINEAALSSLAEMGFTHIWLMGVLQQATWTDYSAIREPADDPDLLKGLAGSPYAIRDYFDVCPDYADHPAARVAEFTALVDRIHAHDMQVLIDFVPNHVARSYHSNVKPELDFGAHDDRSKFFDVRNNFFYLPGEPPLRLPTFENGQPLSPTCKVLGDKCDGFFEGEKTFGRVTGNNVSSWRPRIHDWYETVKLNYGYDFLHGEKTDFHSAATPDTWEKMDTVLDYWQSLGVDGFRCDMAHMIPVEFWSWAIGRARGRKENAFFVAEAYNSDPAKVPGISPNVMTDLLACGFDAVYDDPTYKTLKRIYDGPGWANDIDGALGDKFVFERSLRYAENHDEVRLAGKGMWGDIGMEVGRSIAAILFGLSRGPVMVYNGQEVGEPASGAAGFSGDNARTTIFDYWSMPELAKWVNNHRFDGEGLSDAQKDLRDFYKRLLRLIDEPAFRDGNFYGLNPANANSANFGRVGGDPSGGHWVYAFLRCHHASAQRFLIVVNLHRRVAFEKMLVRIPSEALEFARLPIDLATTLVFHERLGGKVKLSASTEHIAKSGLEIPAIPPLTAFYFEIQSAVP